MLGDTHAQFCDAKAGKDCGRQRIGRDAAADADPFAGGLWPL